ncbi:hypothetical protein BHYA_0390g00050 [Botrytis hyacinthi]|uniref:Chromo domain-containing protein n=1 Tax=Botrytis hyacinthi TaxID=278943 RepID=A0A4Z1G903_9HELO|nr:hypothetical protein BHYA_0390g00050 [Botrytis hyacinthi]
MVRSQAADNSTAEARSQSTKARASTKDDENKEWEVKAILEVKKKWKSLYVRASWVGYRGEDPEWYPISDFKTSPYLLKKFYRENPKALGPPAQLPAWEEAFEAGEEDYEHLNSNKPMDPFSKSRYIKQMFK